MVVLRARNHHNTKEQENEESGQDRRGRSRTIEETKVKVPCAEHCLTRTHGGNRKQASPLMVKTFTYHSAQSYIFKLFSTHQKDARLFHEIVCDLKY